MSMQDEAEELQRLSAQCFSVAKKLQAVSRNVPDSGRKAVLLDISAVCGRLQDELQLQAVSFGAMPQDPAELQGAFAQMFESFVAQFQHYDDANALWRCHDAVEDLRQDVNKAVEHVSDPNTIGLLARHRRDLGEAVLRLRDIAVAAER